MRPARYRLRHQQEVVESCRAFCEGMTNAAGDKQLFVVVKEIEDEERLFVAIVGEAACIRISKSPIQQAKSFSCHSRSDREG
jgi:hypothetical protein